MSQRLSFAASLLAVAAALSAGGAQADVVTQWNFNSVPPDASTTTGSSVASIGAGSASAIGGVTTSFASGSANGGSSDPVTVDDTGWGLTGFAAQGVGDDTRGAQFLVSTVGWQDVVISFDLRHSNTAAAHETVQYTLDGATWVDAGSFVATAGDTWFNGRTVDLSSVDAADNNANFGFRVVASFGSGGAYLASTTGSNYATTGTWRFDMATVSAVSAVPESSSLALTLAGLGAMGLFMSLRNSRRR